MEPLLKVKEAAAALGLNPRVVQNMCRSGELPAVNLNPDGERGVWRVRPSDLRAWVEARKAVRP